MTTTMSRATEHGWSREFEDPIPLPDGRQLVTLQDAGTYVTKLPKADQDAERWQIAIEMLILVAENRRPTMFARIGVMKALNRRVERVFNPDRKDTHGSISPSERHPKREQLEYRYLEQ
jgi:hypothetical protein